MTRTYMPLRVMLEPTGSRFSAFWSWVFFHNPDYSTESTFTRIFGWQVTRIKQQKDQT